MKATEAQQRAERALEMHLAGATYRQIAVRLGITRRSAIRAVKRALEQREIGLDEDVAMAGLLRLDVQLRAVWPKALRGDVQAVDRVLAIDEMRLAIVERMPHR